MFKKLKLLRLSFRLIYYVTTYLNISKNDGQYVHLKSFFQNLI